MNEYTGTDNLEIMAEAINYNQYLTNLVERLATQNSRILDFGAGIGTFAERLHARGYSVEAVETDSKQADVIRSKKIPAYLDIDEIENNSLDYIYSLNVLEHIEDDQAIIHSLFSKLKPGGQLLIYLPAMQILFSSMDEKVCHYRRYSRQSLKHIITSGGFEISQLRYADSLGFFATLAYKWFGNDQGDINRSALIFYDRLAFPLSRILDKLTGRLFGKNVYVIAQKPNKVQL